MTDRINYLTVALREDMRDDDCQPLIDAIRLLRGVASVEKNVTDSQSFTSDTRARQSIGEKLLAILYPNVP